MQKHMEQFLLCTICPFLVSGDGLSVYGMLSLVCRGSYIRL